MNLKKRLCLNGSTNKARRKGIYLLSDMSFGNVKKVEKNIQITHYYSRIQDKITIFQN